MSPLRAPETSATPPDESAQPLRRIAGGKVRDLYEGPDPDTLVMVSSDRISAYDHVLPTEIPDKGRILTAMSVWWFEQLADIVPHHLVDTTFPGMPDAWRGRALVVRRLDMVPVECIARGYLAGSALTDVRENGALAGLRLPSSLRPGARLPEPVFTPTTKAAVGEHDEKMGYAEVVGLMGAATAAELRRLTLEIYRRGHEIAAARGIILADTKLEFGQERSADGQDRLVLADEVLTPDSSRFWPADAWSPGQPQRSYDKQYVRDWLTSPASGWSADSGEPVPPLPDEVVERTRERYTEAYERLTGRPFA